MASKLSEINSKGVSQSSLETVSNRNLVYSVVLLVVTFVAVWVFLFSFQPWFVLRRTEDGVFVTDQEGKNIVDKTKCFFWALIISLVAVVLSWLGYYLLTTFGKK
ncbi:MAG: hypothetical protein KatS3mg101_0920 [Patescibacteria group bacterium]|nr:MAG: hypothetical protein KatS3mg101_0920 [Patescibacteria group bacterium]